MKLRLLLLTIGTALLGLFGTAYAAWNFAGTVSNESLVQTTVPAWYFAGPDAAHIDNVESLNYLTAAAEESLFSPAGSDGEAVRFTNTGGKQSKNHSFILRLERTYTVGEIKNWKVEFDYYYAQKREQAGRGFPKLQLVYGTTNRGSEQGGADLMDYKSPWVCEDIGEGWWRLGYFITALTPTITDHQDKPISESTTVNGFKITDGTIFDYGSNIAFIVVDNARFSEMQSPRLGLFNRTNSFKAGTYYWVKVCWSGELQSVTIATTDSAVAIHAPSDKSPFYIYGVSAGQVDFTVTLVIGPELQTLTISGSVTVT